MTNRDLFDQIIRIIFFISVMLYGVVELVRSEFFKGYVLIILANIFHDIASMKWEQLKKRYENND